MRSIDTLTSPFRPFVSTCALVGALTMLAGWLQPHGVLAQDPEQPLPCPSVVPGTPEPEWFKGAARPGAGLTNPTLVKSSKPEYTPQAEAAGITGEVWLDARVDTDGRVRNVCIVKSLPTLDAQAAKAAKGFEFRPGQQNGVAVPVIVRIQIAFNLRAK